MFLPTSTSPNPHGVSTFPDTAVLNILLLTNMSILSARLALQTALTTPLTPQRWGSFHRRLLLQNINTVGYIWKSTGTHVIGHPHG